MIITKPRAASGTKTRLNGEIDSVLAVRVEGGLVTGLYIVRNSQKLSRVERETALSR
jgi:RNA polymerase sigma-70 factor (ECF subfamily)